MFVRGLYGFKKPLPATPGFEGSGTVVEAGSGMMARFLKGRRVACAAAAPDIAGGMWAEYLVTSAQLCVSLSKHVDMEQGATMLVNPLTAWALMEEARLGRHRAVVQTAAASALGRMLVRLGQRFSIPIINVVRRAEQAELLRKMGAEHVLNTGDPDFDASLQELCRRLGATISFDAVAGEMSARVIRAQPRGSRILVYGALSLEASQVDPASLIFEGKRVEGFWLTAWLRHKSMLSQLRVSRRVQALLAGDLKTEIRARLPLEGAARGLEQYAANMTGGKILLMPSSTAGG
jgi:NADPH:quinone reductase-like Zn-dependent oxidoreductase